MNTVEIGRIEHEGVKYILDAEIVMWGEVKVPYIAIAITTKSSKKVREKKCSSKADAHFNLLSVKNPITLSRKILAMFETFLIEYDYVLFSAYSDLRSKRERVYQKALESIGFKPVYHYTRYLYDISDYLMIRDTRTPPKGKEIKSAFNIMYAHLD